MSKWLNNEKQIWEHALKPCRVLGFCPYGQLVEEFPLKEDKKVSCEIFGHDCPVFYQAEIIGENKKITEEEHKRFNEEIISKKRKK